MKNKKEYAHLNQTHRDRIQALRDSSHTQKEIAAILKVDPSTISREIQRNRRKKRVKGGTRDGPYESTSAQHKAYLRRYHAKWRVKKINQNQELQAYIIEKLKHHWNPDEISGRMKKEHQPFYASKTAIYAWLRTGMGAKYCHYLYSGRHTVKRRKSKKLKKTLIPHRISIIKRPLGATHKTRYGHWESDTIVSGKHTGSKVAGSVAYERKAKYIEARKIPNLKPASHNHAIIDMLHNKKALSISEDNGIENTRHEELGIPVYFCDPYSSWQKGGVEHANKMIRRYIPKGADIGGYTDEDFRRITVILNNKPRRSLKYKTPYEVMVEHHLFVDNKKTEVALRG
ncbi:MAG: IS30 family transposase [Patescibacteria group bacterium]